MLRKNFFITGLPRSRTVWLSNFLSHADVYCYHELIRHADDISGMVELLNSRQEFNVGTADSSFPFYADEIMPHAISPKIIIIDRDKEEVFQSLIQAFGAKYTTMLGELVDLTINALEVMKNRYVTTTIPFEELDDPLVVCKLWDALSFAPFDDVRFKELSQFKMEVNITYYMGGLETQRVEHLNFRMKKFKEAVNG